MPDDSPEPLPPDPKLEPLPGELFDLGLRPDTRSPSRIWQPPTVAELQRSLPQYEISAFIARGGMGAVYKGIQKSLRRVVAIKVLPPDVDEDDLQFAARFKHEAQAMAQLSHPNIVAVHDAGETADGLLYFVMEFIEGTDVARLIASEGKVDPQHALGIIAEVCDALGFAHESGIIHRDIKPSNIMLDKRGRVKVADFGLAKTVNLEATQMTGTDLAMGSPDFIAPEAGVPGIKVDQRADLYSVGVMLYQMLTGKIPRGRFERLSRAVPGLDKRLDVIVDRALQNKREARYPNASELRAALDPITRSLTKRTTAIARRKTHGSRESLLWALAVVVVLMVVVGAFVLKKSQPKSEAGAGKLGADATPDPLHTWEHNVFAAMDRTDATQGMTQAQMQGPLLHLWGNEGWLAPGRNFRDVAVRTLLVWAKGTQNLKLVTRVWMGQGAQHDHYFARLLPNVIEVGLFQDGADRNIKTVPITRTWKDGDEVDLQFASIGSLHTVWLNGQIITSFSDSTVMEPGTAGIQAGDALFKSFDDLPLDGLPEAEELKLVGISSATSQSPSAAQGSGSLRKRQWKEVELAALAQAEVARDAKYSEVSSGRLHLKLNDAWFSPGPFVNGAVRASIHWTDKTNLPQVLMRKTAAPPRYYLRALPDGSAEVGIKRPQEIVLARYPGGTARKVGDEVRLQLACIGRQITAWMDGRLLGSLEDSTATDEGSAGIQAHDAEFTALESIKLDGMSDAEALKLVSLDAAGKEMPSAAADAPALPVDGWKPFITDLAALKTRTGVTLLPDGWLRLEAAYLEGPRLRNVALRTRLRFQQSTAWALKIRENKTTYEAYTVAVSSDGSAVTLRRMGVGAKEGNILAKVPLPSRIAAGQEYELTLAASGDVLTVYLDGKPIIYQLDTICKEGGVTLGASARSEVKDAQWLSLGSTATSAP